MPIKTTIFNNAEKKFLLFLGDLVIVLVSLNVFVNHAIDSKFLSFRVQATIFVFGLLNYFLIAYVLEFYSVQRTISRRFAISQSIYITGIFVFLTFTFTILVYDASFWRRPLLAFLALTPFEIALWRILIANVFKLIPAIKNVLYVYDSQTEKFLKQDISVINGDEIESFYRVKLTYSISDKNSTGKRFFLEAAEKVDAWILNVKNYNNLSGDLEKVLIRSMIRGKEIISYSSFYESTYEALPSVLTMIAFTKFCN